MLILFAIFVAIWIYKKGREDSLSIDRDSRDIALETGFSRYTEMVVLGAGTVVFVISALNNFAMGPLAIGLFALGGRIIFSKVTQKNGILNDLPIALKVIGIIIFWTVVIVMTIGLFVEYCYGNPQNRRFVVPGMLVMYIVLFEVIRKKFIKSQ